MRIIKKTIYLIIIICFCILTISNALTIKAAATKVHPMQNTKFSKYVNVIHNETYNQPIVLDTLEHNKMYNIGLKCMSDYPEGATVDATYTIKKNIGYKCNGIFYTDSLVIDQTGKYVIQIYYILYDNNGYAEPKGNSLETLTFFFEKTEILSLSRTTFYYEHSRNQSNPIEDFVQNVQKSLSQNKAQLTTETIANLQEDYQKFAKIKTEHPTQDISEQVNKKRVIKAIYLNKTFAFTVEFKTTTGEKMTYSVSVIQNAIPLYWVLPLEERKNLGTVNDLHKQYFESLIQQYISPFIDDFCSNYQLFCANYSVNISTLSNTQPIQYQLLINNQQIVFTIYVLFCDLNSVNPNECFSLEYTIDNNKISYKKTINAASLLKNVKILVNLNSRKYIDVLAQIKYFNNSSLINVEVDNDSLGKKEGTICFATSYIAPDGKMLSLTDKKKIVVEVIDNRPPIILTNYNIVIMDKERADYTNQFRFIDDVEIDKNSINFELDSYSNESGYVTVSVKDTSGNETNQKFYYTRRTTPSAFTKTIQKWLYNYGQFLKRLF